MKQDTEKMLDLIIELQSLTQAGLFYCHDVFCQERYLRMREIAAEMLSIYTDTSIEKVNDLFCSDTGYQTPKLDTRAVIFNDQDELLLVQESDGLWSLPGGWVDINTSIKENTIKEVQEEAGLTVECDRLLALLDRDKHNSPKYPYKVIKAFVLCHVISGEFRKNIETISCGYFALDQLPPLAEAKNNAAQMKLCYEAYKNQDWTVIFD